MADAKAHRWQFAARFRRNAFGWRSQPAIERVREAALEIKKTARRDPILAAAGAVLFIEKVSPALEHVDSSSGAIGTAVNHAIVELVSIIAKAPADLAKRARWLERLWEALMLDAIPYIERLGDFWGELCASKELASLWADNLIEPLRRSWEKRGGGSYFQGTPVCFSSLLAAERYQELLELLETAPSIWWEYRRWGVRALLAMGRADEAIRYAEAPRGLNDNPELIARACEEILLSLGRSAEAYERYAIAANRGASYVAAFRAIVRKYPAQEPQRVLRDLVARTPGQEGKWFAAAKEAGLLEMAIGLANQSPCDPKTLTRAARDFIEQNPVFALEAGLAALRWLGEGFGYEVSGVDVWAAYSHTINAADRVGRCDEVRERVRALVTGHRFLVEVLGRDLGLTGKAVP
jgi:tetratricopeptide (TPR) repeat protein